MFATTGTLVPQRSAELCEANQKTKFFEDGGVLSRSMVFAICSVKNPLRTFSLEKRKTSLAFGTPLGI